MANLGIDPALRIAAERADIDQGHHYHRNWWPRDTPVFGGELPALRSGSQDSRRKGELAHGFPRGARPGEFSHSASFGDHSK